MLTNIPELHRISNRCMYLGKKNLTLKKKQKSILKRKNYTEAAFVKMQKNLLSIILS